MDFGIGAQLYTVRDYCKTIEGFEDSISRVAKIGYKSVQISGTGNFDAEIMRNILNKYGVTAPITHTSPEKIKDNTEEVIKNHKILGASYIGIGMMPGEYQCSEEGARRFIKDFTKAANEIADAGLKLMYHNHALEFEKFNGNTIFDILTEGFDNSSLGFTVDVYWAAYAGADPALLLSKLPGRVDTVHFKDMNIVSGSQRMCEVMEGNLNWAAIIEACNKSGVKWAFIEQDDCYGSDPFSCLEKSLKNLSGYTG